MELQVPVETSSSSAFSEDFEGIFPADNWLVGDADSNNGEDYWWNNSYQLHGGNWSGWCAGIGNQTTTVTKFTEDFEGAFPGSWTVVDNNPSSGQDYWDDISYRSYEGSWSAWCADMGTKVTTTNIFFEDFEGVWPGSWIVGDSNPDSGLDYWGSSSIRSFQLFRSGYCADEGSHPIGCGYDNDMDAYMYRSVDLSGYSTVTFSYWYWLDVESNFDKLYVMYYDGSWHYIDEHTGNSGGWQHSSVSIPTSASYVGLRFYSDFIICSYDGAFVDQVLLTGTKEVLNRSVHEYDNDMHAYMYRSVDLSGCASATLSYWYWVDCESSLDYLQVIFYNGSWNYIDEHTGNSSGWQNSNVSIPTSTTHVGFFFHSDSSVDDFEGAYVDDVSLTADAYTNNTLLHTYDDFMGAYMVRKYVIDASSWASATISYWAWHQTEINSDYCQVIVTDDGGTNWYYIGEQLTGTSDWSYHSLSIPNTYLTSLFSIGFMFSSDESTHNYEGVYLDDIVLEYSEVGEPDIDVDPMHLDFYAEASAASQGLLISETTDSLTTTINLIYRPAEPVSTEVEGYDLLFVPGTDGFTTTPGNPRLPVRTTCILVPPQVDVSVDLLNRESVFLKGDFHILPAQEPHSNVGEHDFTLANSEVYSLDSEWPLNVFDIVGFRQSREYRILVIRLFPLSYIPQRNKVILNKDVEISISFDNRFHTISPSKRSELFDNMVSNIVLNPDDMGKFYLSENTGVFLSSPVIVTPPNKTVEEVDPTQVKYVIVTPQSFETSAQPLADWKTSRGINAEVFTLEYITSTRSGIDTQEKIRNFLIDCYNYWGTEWVLLAGDVGQVPTRMVYCPDGYDPDGDYVPCDYYYADLTGDWDSNGNGLWGETSDAVDWAAEVFVGRLPAQTSTELKSMVSKIINYEQNPPRGLWASRMVFTGAYDNYENENNTGWAKTDEAKTKELIRTNLLPSSYSYFRLYEKAGVDPSDYNCEAPLTEDNVEIMLNSGYSLANFAGHGNNYGIYRKVWVSDSNGNGIPESNEISSYNLITKNTSFSNDMKLFLAYGSACSSAEVDVSESFGEYILKISDGAIGYVGATRVSFYAIGWNLGDGYDQELDYRFWQYFFDASVEMKPGAALYLSKLWYANTYTTTSSAHRKDLFTYLLLGDPEIKMPTEEELCQPITIYNRGSADLEVTSIVCDQPWLSASPPCPPLFIIPPGESQVVTICVDPTGLSVGVYYGNVQIYSNDPDENPVAVTVTLHVSDTTLPPAPVISSPTHPDENEWFSNNDPMLEWTTPSDPSGIDGYSYTLDHSPSTTPDTTPDTTGNSASFFDIADGEWWFHVRCHDLACNWGPAGHFRVGIDTTPPSAPSISSISHPNEDLWYNDNDPTFSWATPSDASGIAGYSYELDQMPSTLPDETVDTSGNSESYTDVGDGEWYFHVRAKDNAGNWGSADHYRVRIDTTAPTVIANTPTGTHVPLDTTIEVTFSESMDKPSAQGAFSISPTVSGSFSWSGNTMIFTPDSNLAYGTTYTVTIGTGAMDIAGNYLQSPYNWQFTTESLITYDVTIKAHCNSEGVDVSVSFTWNGFLYTTPKTYTDQTGSHEVVIEERDPNGHPFVKWLKDSADYSTDRTITVSSGGTYTAIYEATSIPAFTTCDEDGNVKSTFQRTETVYVCFTATYPDGSSVTTGSATIKIQLSTDDGVTWTNKTTLTTAYDISKGKWFTAVGYKIAKDEPFLSAPISPVRWGALFPANALDDGSGNKGPFPQISFNFSVDKADLNVAITDGMILGQTYQRTLTTATIKFTITYPDGSHFTTSDLGQITVTITDGVNTYTLKLSASGYNSVTKKWSASWLIPKDAALSTAYKFKIVADDVFDSVTPDPNSGPLVDISDVNAFSVVKASLTVTMANQPATSYYRGQKASFDIRIQYPDLSYFTVADIGTTGFIEVNVYYNTTLITTIRIDSTNASTYWRASFNGFTICWDIPPDAPLTTPTAKYWFTIEQDRIQDTVTAPNTGPATAISSNPFDVTDESLLLLLLLLLLWWLW